MQQGFQLRIVQCLVFFVQLNLALFSTTSARVKIQKKDQKGGIQAQESLFPGMSGRLQFALHFATKMQRQL